MTCVRISRDETTKTCPDYLRIRPSRDTAFRPLRLAANRGAFGMLLATKFTHLTIKRTEDRDFRVAYKLDTIKERLGVGHRHALHVQERTAAYEATREDAERTARAMAREWMLTADMDATNALLAIQAEVMA
jgi:hypothetical protein